jgi:hypothetical protein
LSGLPLVLILENDLMTFHVFDRRWQGQSLHFSWGSNSNSIKDDQTNSEWSLNGHCLHGTLQGASLTQIQAYQEFWHSWSSFHPLTTQYNFHPDPQGK